ncbi:MAG TPA: HD domain-containing phosphohydrolase [Acidimicrobiales bacterium]|nr:HD domain-containing phosphohydrolase [Acidimicrobiales bacterium]
MDSGLLNALVKGSDDLFGLADANGVITFLAGNVEETLGIDRPSLIGMNALDLVQGADVERAEQTLRQIVNSSNRVPAGDYWFSLPGRRWLCMSITFTNCLDDPATGAIVINAHDVTEQRLADSARRAMIGASSALVRATTEDDLYHEICRVVVGDVAYDLAFVAVSDSSHPLGIRLLASSGPGLSSYFDAHKNLSGTRRAHNGPLVKALETLEIQVIQDIAELPEYVSWRNLALEFGFRSAIALPIAHASMEPAMLAIYSKRPHAFSQAPVEVLSALATDLSFGVDNLRSRTQRAAYQNRFEASLGATVRAIATAAEIRDPYTAGHQRGVEGLARAIAADLGFDSDVTMGIGVAASIHDIGKLAVPAEILSKPGRLSAAEFAIVREHPQAGYDIVAGIDFPWPIAELILNHHERLDGSGYPRGAAGEEISMGTRILAVADVVEAMHSHRPYRPAPGLKVALREVESGRGTLFDPDVVRSCTNLFRKTGFEFSRDSFSFAVPNAN